MHSYLRHVLLIGVSTFAASQALAQGTPDAGAAPPGKPAAAAAASGNTGVADIIVTAQRRAENLISVPLSITAQTAQTLQQNGIKQLSEMKFTTPGYLSAAGTGYTQIYIRGIGNGVYVGADPSVATFIDDVPHIYGSLVEDLVNIDRVEILKGAQGGLYGRNASGGVVNIITKQPSDKFSADMRLTGGSYGTLQASAYVNVPLSDRVAFNISVTRNQHDPYLKNVAYKNPYPANSMIFGVNANSLSNPTAVNNQNLWSFDSKLRVRLTDNFKITLAGDWTNKHDADGNGWITTNPASQYGTYVYFMNTYVNYPGHPGPDVPVVPQWPTLSLKSGKVYGAYPNTSWTKDYGTSATAVLDTDFATLTSISAYRWNDSHFQGDVGAAPVPIAGFTTHFERQYFYQELRAVSSGSGPFHWLAGGTYLHDHVDVSIASILLGFPFPPTISQYHTTSWSVYGQVGYDFTDNLTLTTSLRYAHETKTVAFPAPDPSVATTVASAPIPAATLSYKLNGGGTIYARYAKGFKTGGPESLVRPDRLPPGSPGLTLKPETVNTYEVGFKANLFNRKVQVTSAIFYNKYKDIQVTDSGTVGNTDISNALVNLKSARTYGAEGTVTWRVIPPLTISANIGYLNAKYTSAEFAGNLYLLPINATGKTMIAAPEWQGGVQISLDQPLNDSTRLKANLLYSYIGKHYFTADNDEDASQKAYSLVNIRGGVTLMNNRVGLYVFVNNLFDKRFFVFGSSGTFAFENPGAPRVVGGTVELHF